MKVTPKGRLYQRNGRWYADLRDYSDLSEVAGETLGAGRRIALCRVGETRGTTDADEATTLLAKRLEALRQLRTHKRTTTYQPFTLAVYAAHHLECKAESGQFTDAYLTNSELHLSRACEFFGSGTYLTDIPVRRVSDWLKQLRKHPNGRGGTLSEKSVLAHLHTLSNLYQRAIGDEVVPPGYNPPRGLFEKPRAEPSEARFFEVDEVALLLESARTFEPLPDKHGTELAYPLIATFALTGARKSEGFGLTVEDVSFERETVTIRPNDWRRLKTRNARRVVPLWPQLATILLAYLNGPLGPSEGLLFPSHRTGGVIVNCRKTLDAVGGRVGFPVGEVRLHALRHSYCAARLQTLDHGYPVSDYVVMREMGHGSPRLVHEIYGHLGTVRHRSEVVEFRVAQHEERLKDRLQLIA